MNKRKVDLSKCTIEYGGEKFNLDDLYGTEDYSKLGGIWGMVNKCAGFVVAGLEDKLQFDADEQSDMVFNEVRNTVYSLIKFRMLRPLNNQLNSSSQSKKDMVM